MRFPVLIIVVVVSVAANVARATFDPLSGPSNSFQAAFSEENTSPSLGMGVGDGWVTSPGIRIWSDDRLLDLIDLMIFLDIREPGEWPAMQVRGSADLEAWTPWQSAELCEGKCLRKPLTTTDANGVATLTWQERTVYESPYAKAWKVRLRSRPDTKSMRVLNQPIVEEKETSELYEVRDSREKFPVNGIRYIQVRWSETAGIIHGFRVEGTVYYSGLKP